MRQRVGEKLQIFFFANFKNTKNSTFEWKGKVFFCKTAQLIVIMHKVLNIREMK